jgi:acetolactate synthase I/II/III large subunit
MQRNGAQLITDFLEQRGVRVVAGMPGGANLPMYDALHASRIRHVLVRHEQAAGFIAQGMARVSGRAGVCFATSGPGATNLVTPLADARMDSVPVVAITGQVPTALLGTDAFQEVDAVSIFRPVVKHALMVRRIEDLWPALQHGFDLAEAGRPGPVLIDVPKDVQQASIAAPEAATPPPTAAAQPVPDALLARAVELLRGASRPVLYIGGGVSRAAAHALVAQLAVREQLPVVCSLMGLGAFDPAHPLYCGMLGMHAAPYTNLLLHECDLLLAIGVRFDDRATGKLSEFCPNARTVHVDIDAREIGKLRRVDVGIVSDAARFLRAFLPWTRETARPSWLERVARLRAQHPLPERAPHVGLHPLAILRALSESIAPETPVTTDVGQHQMWVAQSLPIRSPRQLLTSGGLGSMGFGLPAAIGAALACGARAVCITGDGSLALNIHELATLAELDLDVVIVLFDNRHLGLVRQQQTLFYGERLHACAFQKQTDFLTVARGFGVEACDWRPEDSLSTLHSLLAQRGPRLIRVPLMAAEMVLPMVPPGAGNCEMLGISGATSQA